MKYLLFITLFLTSTCTRISTQNELNNHSSATTIKTISSKNDILSKEQINYLSQSELPKFEDFKMLSIPANIKEYMIPTMLNGRVIIDIDRNGKPEKTIFVFKDSLLIEMTQRNYTSEIGYDEQKRVNKLDSREFSYNEDGLFNKYQWGTRSNEYIKEKNCITEIYLDGRDELGMYKSYCYNQAEQIIRDSSWYVSFSNGQNETMHTSVSNFEYANNKITKSFHAQYKDSKKLKTNMNEISPEMDKFYSFDTLRHYFINYSYDDIGLLKEKKTLGVQRNTNSLEKEDVKKTIQFEYEFISEEPLKIKTRKTVLDGQKEAVTYTLEDSFNSEGYPIQRKYRGPSVLNPDFYMITNFTYIID